MRSFIKSYLPAASDLTPQLQQYIEYIDGNNADVASLICAEKYSYYRAMSAKTQ